MSNNYENEEKNDMTTASNLIERVAGPPGRSRRGFWWAGVGLGILLTVTGSIGNAIAASSIGGVLAGVLVAVVMPLLLLVFALGAAVVLRRLARWKDIGDVFDFLVLPMVVAIALVAGIGAVLAFIGQPVREFAVLGGVAEDWAWVFPFAVEALFVLALIGLVMASVTTGVDVDADEEVSA